MKRVANAFFNGEYKLLFLDIIAEGKRCVGEVERAKILFRFKRDSHPRVERISHEVKCYDTTCALALLCETVQGNSVDRVGCAWCLSETQQTKRSKAWLNWRRPGGPAN